MVPSVRLIRLESFTVTLGALLISDELFCVTLEPPYRENKVSESSIPAGQYICRRVTSPRFGETFEVEDVPYRSDILFHWGNSIGDTHGCIILGTSWHTNPDGQKTVLSSRVKFSKFMELMAGTDRFNLTIREVY